MNRHRGLLALTTDGARTGATLLLASLLDELGRDGAVDPARTRVVAGRGGAQETDLARAAAIREAAPASDVAGEVAARLHPGARRAGARIGLTWGLVRAPRADPGPPDLVWAHGANAVHLADALPRRARRAPLVACVHEPGVGLRRALGDVPAGRALAPADLVVATSAATRDHLVRDVGLAPTRVLVHLPWVPGLGATAPRAVTPRRPTRVPVDALVVAGCGTIGWRRGTDLFLDLAARLPAEVDGRPVHLVWIGGVGEPGADQRIAADVAARDLGARVELVGEVDDVAPWLAGADVVVATGRTEALPGAALEAGVRGRAVVGWRSSGIAEVLPGDVRAECLVDDFDGPALAARVLDLLRTPAARRSLGAELRAHVLTHHQAAPRVAALWSDVAAHLARL